MLKVENTCHFSHMYTLAYTCMSIPAFISICFVCVCVCVSVFICGQARPTLSEYLKNSTQWWPLLNCGGKNQPCGSNLAMERTNRYPHNVAIECVYGCVCVCVCVCMSMCIYKHEWVHWHMHSAESLYYKFEIKWIAITHFFWNRWVTFIHPSCEIVFEYM